jgi:type II secretory ATPase GspE/PulE/Tfp pilus assembly ATPase PilB-like protein
MTTAVATPTKLVIGDVFVGKGILTNEQRCNCLAEQVRLRESGTPRLFGQIAVDLGYLSLEVVEKVVEEISHTRKPTQSRNGRFYSRFREEVIGLIGAEQYANAAMKKEALGDDHLINTLHVLDLLSYQDTFKLLKKIVAELGRDNVRVEYKQEDILIIDGEVYLRTDGNSNIKVSPEYFPKDTTDIQLLLQYDEYERLRTKVSVKSHAHTTITQSHTFKEIVQKAVLARASDIHIQPSPDHYRVFFRIDGMLVEDPLLVMNSDQGVDLTHQIMIEANEYTRGSFRPEETKTAQAAKLVYDSLGVSLRLQFVPDGYTLKHLDTTARIITNKSTNISDNLRSNLRSLGFLEEDIPLLEGIMHRRNGLVVFSGVVGSGKSTSIWNVLPAFPQTMRIGTIEDPIEKIMNMKNIVQHQLYEPEKDDLVMGYEDFIKAFKRGDYDIIFIGEWRQSKGLTQAMIEQANAGQLIFTTLHINRSFEVYSALNEMFGVSKNTSARLILLSVNQCLLQKLCPKCKEPQEISFTEEEIHYLTTLSDIEKEKLLIFHEQGYKKSEGGCEECRYTGYKERTVVYDFFVPPQDFINKGVESLNPADIRTTILDQGLGRTKMSVFFERLKEGIIGKEGIYKI